MVATLPNQVVDAKNHLRLFLWILMGSILFYAVLAIFWHALLAHLFELQLGLGRACAREAAPLGTFQDL